MEILSAMKNMENSTQYEPAHLINEYATPVYRFCRSMTYCKEDAEDLFQETFLRALEQPQKMDSFCNPQSYLFSTALYIWKGWKRKYARRKRLAPVVPLDETAESCTSIEGDFMAQEESVIVRELVDALPDKYKIPTILYYALEMSVSDIAAAMRIPAGTVKSRLYKARQLVEKGLGATEYEK